MASPDFSEYIDLTVNDLQPDELYEAAQDYARIALPEFEPRAGSVEDALLQAVSFAGAVNLAAINRLTDGLMEGLLRLYGLERREATSSTVTVQFTLLNTNSTVPRNFTVAYEVVDGDETVQYPFYLEDPVTSGIGSTTVTATLTCLVVGSIPTIPIGTNLLVTTTSSNVLSCTTTASVVQGLDSETESEYFNRGVSFLASLNQSLNTVSQIENYVLTNYPEVGRCKAYDLCFSASNVHDTTFAAGNITINTSTGVSTIQTNINNVGYGNPYPTPTYTQEWRLVWPFHYDGVTTPGLASGLMNNGSWNGFGQSDTYNGTLSITAQGTPLPSTASFVDTVYVTGLKKTNQTQNPVPGAVTIAILGQAGKPVSRDVKKAIYEDVKSKITAGMYVSVIDAWPYDIDVVVNIVVESGYSEVLVEQEVADLIESYYSPEQFPLWSEAISFNDIASLAASVTGVKSVYSVVVTVPVYGGNTSTRSIYYNNASMATISEVVSKVFYVKPTYLATLPSASATVASVAIPT